MILFLQPIHPNDVIGGHSSVHFVWVRWLGSGLGSASFIVKKTHDEWSTNLQSKGARKPRIVDRLLRNGHTLWIIDQWRCGIPSDDVNFAMLNEGRAPGRGRYSRLGRDSEISTTCNVMMAVNLSIAALWVARGPILAQCLQMCKPYSGTEHAKNGSAGSD